MSLTAVKDALRHVPGLVAAKRRAVTTWRVLRPLRPPVESPDLVRRMLVMPEDETYLTGNGVASHCRYVLNYDTFRVNEAVENDWWFCNPEFLEYFFRRLAPRDEEYVLFTHNSNVDRPIDGRFARQLERPELLGWFATNAALWHPKLFSLPLGVGNPIKCDHAALKRVAARRPGKTRLFDAAFSLWTNPAERAYCLEQTGVEPDAFVPQPEYFERVASSYFCLSPNGNGVDCYRTWQAFHLRTVPIVTRSLLTEQHPDLPWIVLDDWSQFRTIRFTPELYERTWGDWDPGEIALDRYLRHVEGRIRSRGTGEPAAVARVAARLR